jgi:hypothetical protein
MTLSQLDDLFRELFASKSRLRYGISVTGAAPDLSTIDVDFRFLTGQSYCCIEPGCHLPWSCADLVRLAAERSGRLPDDVVVKWHCIVEEGARDQTLRAFGRSVESKAHEFDFVSGDPSARINAADGSGKPPLGFTGLWTVDLGNGARTETEYVDGIPNGRFCHWNADGVCLKEGAKKNGLWDGILILRTSGGTVLDASEFSEGTGIYRIFNSLGQLTDEFPLRHGKPHGAVTTWRGGKRAVVRHFVDGQCVAANCSPACLPGPEGLPDR